MGKRGRDHPDTPLERGLLAQGQGCAKALSPPHHGPT
jgi:hypothetical protein